MCLQALCIFISEVIPMSYERVIEYLEMIKEEYPGGDVCEACDKAIELIKKEIRKCSGE